MCRFSLGDSYSWPPLSLLLPAQLPTLCDNHHQVNIRAGHLPVRKSNLFPDRVLFTLPVMVPPNLQ